MPPLQGLAGKFWFLLVAAGIMLYLWFLLCRCSSTGAAVASCSDSSASNASSKTRKPKHPVSPRPPLGADRVLIRRDEPHPTGGSSFIVPDYSQDPPHRRLGLQTSEPRPKQAPVGSGRGGPE